MKNNKAEINSILNKGVVDVIVRADLEKKLNSGKKIRVKFGIDPTGSDLHLGHMVPLRKLGELQRAGHEITLIFGNFTGQIGDPTDKTEARKPKTQQELEENAKYYLEQAKFALDTKKLKQVWNADWLGPLNFANIVTLASNFTVAQMLERDMFQDRIKKDLPISMHEFFYPLMQGYDSVHLKSELEIGGTDQTFNLLAGRTLQKAYGQEPQNILTVPILPGTDGKIKMSKSEKNYIAVHESPKDMFGKIMSIPDHLIFTYFELCTDLDLEQISELKKKLDKGENPRNLKIKLAKEIVTIYHNQDKANQAEADFIEVFTKGGLPENIAEKKISNSEVNIQDLLVELKFSSSKSEARRLIEGGAVKYDGEKISDPFAKVKIDKSKKLLQAGKRNFIYLHQ